MRRRRTPPISEGDLLAYLDGKHCRHVACALDQSPVLRARLRRLASIVRQIEMLLNAPPPPPAISRPTPPPESSPSSE